MKAQVKHNHFIMSETEKLEKDFYEYKPYLYAALAVFCFVYKNNYSTILNLSGVLFTIASSAVFYLRYFARNYR